MALELLNEPPFDCEGVYAGAPPLWPDMQARLRQREGSEHIAIRDAAKCRACFARYAAPCARFCPAGVYEADAAAAAIRVRPENCLQCRCCTRKCPFDNIHWETPRHGVGPDYRNT